MFWLVLATLLLRVSADAELDALKVQLDQLKHHVMGQQLAMEERVRTSGDSGLKKIRLMTAGTNPYMTESHTLISAMSMHDHTNNIRTIGLGEIAVVLNGVEFRTRHNDYRLYTPSSTSTEYHAQENIPFPPVPPAVEALTNVDDQVAEMITWFEAFKTQNIALRDYRDYFKPVLCYLEGAWTFPDGPDIEEPFESDRHKIDATTWEDLEQKIRFTSATGTKSNFENYAYLPRMIANNDNGVLKFAQWNYRIMCHPLSKDLPTNNFKLIDDFHSRMYYRNNIPAQELKRAARFVIRPDANTPWPVDGPDESSYYSGQIDDMMYEIPGKDNYLANETDDAFGMVTRKVDGSVLNAGFYHRSLETTIKGAMGVAEFFRGFNDQNAYTALNSQDKIMTNNVIDCKGANNLQCKPYPQKVSYAIPLEIVYLTPLSNWNPYGIVDRGDYESEAAIPVTENGARDGLTNETALNGVHSKLYFRTPYEFFSGDEVNKNAADTTAPWLYVLDPNGEPHKVAASGSRIILPEIGEFGNTRLRYPIYPLHEEGSVTRKELEGVKEGFLELGRPENNLLLRVPLVLTPPAPAAASDLVIQLKPAEGTNAENVHTITLTEAEKYSLIDGGTVTKMSSNDDNHGHEVTFTYNAAQQQYMVQACDGNDTKCGGHLKGMTPVV